MNSVQCGSSANSGVPNVDISAIAEAYGITSYYVKSNTDVYRILDIVYNASLGPTLCEVNIHPEQGIFPKAKAGQPLHNQYPYIENVEEIIR
jgi:thiamine pyrophosphate-dependent acetolactate synthase large subunit-like protein